MVNRRGVIAAVMSYEHAYALVHAHGRRGDGSPHPLSRWMGSSGRAQWSCSTQGGVRMSASRGGFRLGHCVHVRASVAHSLKPRSSGAMALVDSYELLMMIVCGAQLTEMSAGCPR